MRLRAKVTIRNDHMLAARERKGLSQSALAGKAGVSVQRVGDFEKLKFNTGTVLAMRTAAEQIALVLEIPDEQVFPPELENTAIESERTAIRDVDTKALLSATNAIESRMIAMGPDEELAGTRVAARELLESLIARWETEDKPYLAASPTSGMRVRARSTKRALEILKLRSDGLTFEEIGGRLGVSTERVRQLELKGIKALQKVAGRHGVDWEGSRT